MPSYQVSDYASLERDADMGFYFSSPVLGQVFPRLPNTLNVGFIHCRYANHQSGEQKSSDQFLDVIASLDLGYESQSVRIISLKKTL